MIVPFFVILLVGFTISPVAAASFGTPSTAQLIKNNEAIATMGFTTEVFLSYGSELHPQYYAATIACGSQQNGLFYYPQTVRIDVEGYDPLGNKLSPDRFTSLSIMVSPQDNQIEQEILKIIYDSIVDMLPAGVKSTVKDTSVEGGGWTEYGSLYATAIWQNPIWAYPEMARGVRMGFQLAVDPSVEGTYTIHVYTAMIVYAYDPNGISHYIGSRALVRDLYYLYDAQPTGGGCPILTVFNGTGYANEGLLGIHSDTDVVRSFVIHSTPAAVDGTYRMRLTEYPQTRSHIDKVQLYGRLSDGRVMKIPLISATHSSLGDVKYLLMNSDDARVTTLGAKYNNGTSQYIDLQFKAFENLNFVQYIFQIEGHNSDVKY